MGFDFEGAERTRNRGNFVELKEGENYIRILPPSSAYFTSEVKDIAISFLRHYNIEQSDGFTGIICPKTQGRDKHCLVCDLSWHLRKANQPAAESAAQRLNARLRFLFNVLVKDENGNFVMKVLEAGPKIHTELLGAVLDRMYCDPKNPARSTPIDPELGRAFKIIKKITGPNKQQDTSYEIRAMPERTSVVAKLPADYQKILDQLPNNIPPILSDDEIKAILMRSPYASVIANMLGDTRQPAKIPNTVSPETWQTPAAQAATESTAAAKADTAAKPDCFGKADKFDKTSARCIECAIRPACINQALSEGGGL